MKITPQIEQHLKANMNISKKDIIVGNFLGGIAWGIGTVVGASVVVAAVLWFLNSLGVFAAVGGFFGALGNTAQQLQQLQNLPQVPQITR